LGKKRLMPLACGAVPSFFPEAGDNERVERVSIVGAPQAKGIKRFLPNRRVDG
jgi:hypothetical protein